MKKTVARNIGIKILLLFIAAIMFRNSPAYADVSGDYGNIAVLQFSSTDPSAYNDSTDNGQPNYDIREWVAHQFYKTHGDYYDFIIVFTNFDFTMYDSSVKLNAAGENWGVKNTVSGIGVSVFDNTSFWGSYGRLQSYIDLGNVSSKLLAQDPNGYNSNMMVLAHELEHQWAAHVHFIDSEGNNSNALLGVDQAHWSYLLDSDASVLYGSQWTSIGNGQYQTTDIEERYSPLDLYLMGFDAPSEVPPMTLLVTPAIDPAQIPQLNAVVSATPTTITIDQIIQAEGERSPDYLNSQKSFKAAFVLLIAPGTLPSPDMINAIDTFRQQWEREFFILTNGRGVMDTHLVGNTPGTFASPPNIISGINWLMAQQSPDGSWFDSSYTTTRDTVESLLALKNFTPASQNVTNGLNWLSASTPTSTDELAQQVNMLSIAGMPPLNWALDLSYLQNPDGGWGPDYGYDSNPMDTSSVLNAVNAAGTYTPGTLDSSLTWLASVQDQDGGWGDTDSGSSRVMTTIDTLNALRKFNPAEFSGAITRGIYWLLLDQKPNGSFGDDGGSVYETAAALLFLESINDNSYAQYITDATNYLLANQLADYSWNDSTYQTALAIQAISLSDLPQLLMGAGDLMLSNSNPYSGETVQIAATVHNTGKAAATNVLVRFFNGNPYNGGIQIGTDQVIPLIVAGGEQTVTIDWDTVGFTGSTIVYAIADPNNVVPEMDTSQKQALVDVNVQPQPVEAQLIVTANDITFNPSYLYSLPSTSVITANISNIGMTNAGNVEVNFYDGDPQYGGILVSMATIPVIPAMGVVQATAAITITTPGTHNIYVWVDPNQQIPQPSRVYNIAYKLLPLYTTIDLAISPSDITFFKNPINMGEHLTVSALVHNNGTQTAQNVLVAFYATAGNGISMPIGTDTIPFIYGNSSYYANIDWLTELSGNPVTITVVVDPYNAIEDYNRSNNIASADVTILPSQLPNLMIVGGRFTVSDPSPKEGELLTISGIVENNGFTTATNIAVDIYVDNSAGGFTINTVTIPSLDPGQTQLISAQWTPVGFRGNHVISMVIDPYSQIQEVTKEDNKADMLVYILSYPDLAIGSGDISFVPNYPPSGAPVKAVVNVHNLGEQGASNVMVNLSEGATQLGITTIPYIAGLSSTYATISFTAGAQGAHVLTAIVDPYNTITEISKDNNQASATLIVQNSNLSVDNMYFSPNGDGIKDTATLTYHQPSGYSGNLTVSVVNELGETVRTFTTTTGPVTWNGLNDQGLLVPDGTYHFVLSSSDGSSTFGTTNVILDTNRYPLMKAVGTQYLRETNLTCGLNGSNYNISPSSVDNGYLAYGGTNRLAFINPDGSFIYLTPQNWQNVSIGDAVISSDGQKVAFTTWNNTTYMESVYVVNNDGSGLKALIPDSSDYYGSLNWSPDSANLIVDEQDGNQTNVDSLWLINVNTGATRLINSTSSDSYSQGQWSNDGRILFLTYSNYSTGYYDLYVANGDGTDLRIAVQNVVRGNPVILISPNGYNVYYGDNNGQWLDNPIIGSKPVLLSGNPSGCQWSPDGSALACISGASTNTPTINFYDASGKISTSYGLGQIYSFSGTTSLYEAGIDIISWLGDGTGVVIDTTVGLPSIGPSLSAMDSELQSSGSETTSIISNIIPDNSSPPDYSYIGVVTPSGHLTKTTPISSSVLANADSFALSPDNRSITFDHSGIGVLDLPTSLVNAVLTPQNPNNVISQSVNNGGALGWSKSGRILNYTDNIYSTNPASPCYKGQYSTDNWAMTSLYNLTDEFTVIKQPNAAAVTITGTVSDINFDHYTLEYALNTTPTTWMPIVASGNTSIVDGYIATWIPPEKGQYMIRFTAYDKAGNKALQTRYLSWSQTARLTNLAVQPLYISPNDDGVQDYATVSFGVIEPGHFDFKIYSSEGQWVNTISRDYTEPTTDSFTWYGTDFNGSVVPDGQYTIKVDNIEIYVTVDDTPPTVEANYLSNTTMLSHYGPIVWRYTAPGLSSSNLLLEVNFGIKTFDDNPYHWDIEASSISNSSTPWNILLDETGNKAESWNANTGVINSKPITMSIAYPADQVIAHNVRLTDTDLAGNTSIATLPSIPEGVFWVTYNGQFVVNNSSTIYLINGDNTFTVGDTITSGIVETKLEYMEEGMGTWSDAGALVQSIPSSHIISLTWNASFDKCANYNLRVHMIDQRGRDYFTPVLTGTEGSSVIILSAGYDASPIDFTVPPRMLTFIGSAALSGINNFVVEYTRQNSTETNINWQPLKTFYQVFPEIVPCNMYCQNSTDNFCLEKCNNMNKDNLFEVGVIPTPLLTNNSCNYSFRIAAYSSDGTIYHSEPVDFNICGISLIGVKSGVALIGHSFTTVQSGEITGSTTSYLDNGGANVQTSYPLSPPDINNINNSETFTIWKPNPHCSGIFGINVIDVTGNFHETSAQYDPVLNIEHYKDYPTECGLQPLYHFNGVLSFNSCPGPAVMPLAFSAQPVTPASACNSLSAPLYNISLSLTPLNITATPFSYLTFSYRPDGLNTPFISLTTFTNPSFGHTYTYQWDASALPRENYEVQALIADISGTTYTVATTIDQTLPNVRITLPGNNEFICPASPIMLSDGTKHYYQPVNGSLYDGTAISDFTLLFENNSDLNWNDMVNYNISRKTNNYSGQLGNWDVTNLNSGAYTLRLSAEDNGGNLSCYDVPVYLSQVPRVSINNVSPEVFSPNGDGNLDTTDINIAIEAINNNTLYIKTLSGSTVKTLVLGAFTQTSVYGIQWDGTDDAGTVVPDGDYILDLVSTSPCGTSNDAQAKVTVDNTPPVAIINYPNTASQNLPLMVGIMGTASDLHFSEYTLEYVSTSTPTKWNVITTSSVPVTSGTLGLWNTYGLSGDYTLRLSAYDLAGNASATTAIINIPPRGNLIEALYVSPTIFSPNKDGREDTANIKYGLAPGCDAGCSITLSIVDTSYNKIKTLTTSTTITSGSYTIIWDGSTDSGATANDGDYSIMLVAANAVTSQTETIPVTVDDMAPAINMTSPLNGNYLTTPTLSIDGSITDLHLSAFNMTYTSASGNTITIDTGTQSRDNYLFGILSSLKDGVYGINISATDLANNISNAVITFTIDTTPPIVKIQSPAAKTIFGGANTSIPITAVVSDINLAQYEILTGTGDTQTAIFSSSISPTTQPVYTWDISHITDGTYNIVLSAIDKAGNSASDSTSVIIDNTPPVTLITMPQPNAVIAGPVDIIGTASDNNLVMYELDISSGVGANTYQWSTIVTGTTSITDSTITNLNTIYPDGYYTLRLLAMDIANNISEYDVPVKYEIAPPQPPANLTASAKFSDVTLEWLPSPGMFVAGYNVYRGGVQINTTPVTDTTYIDSSLPDGAYTYTVTAVNEAGAESGPSNPASVLVDTTPPFTELINPHNGQYVAGDVSIVGIAYSALDFSNYTLEIGEGISPSSWNILVNSPMAVNYGTLADWDTSQYKQGIPYTIQLTASDIHGNTGGVSITVIVNNTAPSGPLNLTASTYISNVTLNWNASANTDIAGYILYRNDQIANALGQPGTNLTPYLITTTSYIDSSLPNGTYTYYVVAMDYAGNMSVSSNSVTVNIETRPPIMWVSQPFTGEVISGPTTVVGTTPDLNIASVQFEYRQTGTSTWQSVGSAVTTQPFQTLFDPYALSLVYGHYDLIAVATDTYSLTNTNPTITTIGYIRTPMGLSALVNQSIVNLSWNTDNNVGVSGYKIYRMTDNSPPVLITASPVSGNIYQDTAPNTGIYTYTITTLDTAGDESIGSAPASANIYSPMLSPLVWITTTIPFDISGNNAASNSVVTIYQVTSAGPITQGSVYADTNGNFTGTVSPSNTGRIALQTSAQDSLGNISLLSNTVSTIYSTIPPIPQGLGITNTDSSVTVNWLPVTDNDLLGYNVYRDNTKVNSDTNISHTGTVSASTDTSANCYSQSPANYANDGDYTTSWIGYCNSGFTPQWLSESFSATSLINGLTIIWASDVDYNTGNMIPVGASDFTVQAWNGYDWVNITGTTGNMQTISTISFAYGVLTSSIRLYINSTQDPYSRKTGITELKALTETPVTQTTYTDPYVSNGIHVYTVTSENIYGLESPQSAGTSVTPAVIPPLSPIDLTATVNIRDIGLSWTTSNTLTNVTYNVYRSYNNAAFTRLNSGLTQTSYDDPGLANGSYSYTVTSVDIAGNESTPSNTATATVNIAPTAPSFSYPANSGDTVTLSVNATDIYGNADPFVMVEVYQNNTYIGSVVSDSGGGFYLYGILLSVGANTFTAVAVDSTGTTSAVSIPLTIDFDTTGLPDISVNSISIYPTVPLAGDQVGVSVSVSNIGTGNTSNVELLLTVQAPDGTTSTVIDSIIPSLPAGQSTIVGGIWDTSITNTGYNLVTAIADPHNQIMEVSKNNNVFYQNVFVTGSASPTIQVSTDRSSYTANDVVTAYVSVTNAGATANVPVNVDIEDSSNNVVTALLNTVINSLAYGQTKTFTLTWNTGATLAGNYDAHGWITGTNNAIISDSKAPFAIAQSVNVSSSITADKLSYNPNENVILNMEVTNNTPNAILSDLTATATITSPSGNIVTTGMFTVPQLMPQDNTSLSKLWNTGLAIPGNYNATMTVWENGNMLSNASTAFNIISIPRLAGTLTLQPNTVGENNPYAINYTLVNTGNVDLTALPITISVIDPLSSNVLATLYDIANIYTDSTYSNILQTSTSGFTPGTYTVILSAIVNSIEDPLATAVLTVKDIIPPMITVISPINGSYFSMPVPMTVSASDDSSGVSNVLYSLDSGSIGSLPLVNGNDLSGTYSYIWSIGKADEGIHNIQFKATDYAGNISQIIASTFTVDVTPPVITVTGVTDSTVYHTPITPVITVQDINLAGSTILLNNMPFTSGTTITAYGAYTLDVKAYDKANNTAETIISFSITPQLPDISVNSISIVPPVPMVGEQAGIAVSVSNIGPGDASNIELLIKAQSLTGPTSTILDTFIPSLQSGQNTVINGTWNITPDYIGSDVMTAVADPNNLITEVSKANNSLSQAVLVTNITSPTIQITLDKPLYGYNDTLTAYIIVSNTGATGDVPVTVDVEDSQGNVVSTLLDTVMSNVGYNQTKTTVVTWNVGATFAGSYNVHGEVQGILNGVSGSVVSESTAAFSITPDTGASATMASDKQIYTINEHAVLDITVTSNTHNAILSDLTTTTIIASPTGSTVTADTFTVPALEPLSSTTLSMMWDTLLNSPGSYTATTNVWENSTLLAVTFTTFDVSRVAALSGAVTLQPAIVGENSAYTIGYTVTNTGNVDQTGVPITISVINPVNSAVLAVLYDAANIGVDSSYYGSFVTLTSGIMPGTYNVVLSAVVDNTEQTLATAVLTILDTIPPVVNILSPLDGSYFSTPVPISAQANDDYSGVRVVMFALDNGSFVDLPLVSGNIMLGTYSSVWTTGKPDEGIHTIGFKALDYAGNISQIIASTFTVDVTPPVITVTGVTDSTVYHTPVTPVITVQDINLAGYTISLNGAPFTNDTTINAQGSYELDVKAYDKANNTSELTINFKIVYDTTPPVTKLIIGPPVYTGTTMVYINSNSLLSLAATDDTAVQSTQYEIDNSGWITYTSPWTIETEGLHAIGYMSTDIYDNVEAAHHITVTVDDTPPVTTINQSTVSPKDIANGVFPYTLFALHATDTGSGVNTTQWAVDGGAWQIYTTPFSLSQYQPGSHSISYRSIDNLGNTEETHITTVTLMRVDVTKSVSVNVPNILVYSQCRNGDDENGSEGEFNTMNEDYGGSSDNRCITIQSNRQMYIASIFSGTDIFYDFTTTAEGFIDLLRSGKYSEYLIFADNGNLFDHACNDDDSESKCGDTKHCYPCTDKEIGSELKEAVNSGAGLILIKYYPSDIPSLSDVLGVEFKGDLQSTNKLFVNIADSGVFHTGTAALQNDSHVAVKITLTTGNMAAYFTGQSNNDRDNEDNTTMQILDLSKGLQPECEGGGGGQTKTSPAIVTNIYGKGMSVLFAYNPLEAVSSNDSLILKKAIIEAIHYAAPATGSTVSSGIVGVSTTVSVYGSNVSLKLEEHVPVQADIMSVSNGGIITGTTITWLLALADNASTTVSEELIGLPGAGTEWTITTLVSYLSLQGYLPYSSYSLTFTASTISTPLTLDTLSALQSLTVTSDEDEERLEHAIRLYKLAVSGACYKSNDDGDDETDDDSKGQMITATTITGTAYCESECSIGKLLKAIYEIEKIKSVDTEGIRFDLDVIIRSYERKWYEVASPS